MDPLLDQVVSSVKEEEGSNPEPSNVGKTYQVLESESKEEGNTHLRFLKERKFHRKVLFYFALVMSALSLASLIALIIAQAYFRATISPYFEIISDQGIEVVSVAIFGEIFGVIYIIAKAIWSNDEFKMRSTDPV